MAGIVAYRRQILEIAGIRQLVQRDDADIGIVCENVSDKGGPNEAGAACHH
jgi:hypothetical protein